MRAFLKNFPLLSRIFVGGTLSDFFGSFLVMSNARAGSTYFQSSLSALGAYGDFEFALRPYGIPISNQKFLSLGIPDIDAEMRDCLGNGRLIYGSKLVLPLYEYLSKDQLLLLSDACKNVSKRIHLVRHYWDLLKSNLSRGVAHDFNLSGKGFASSTAMQNELSKLTSSALGRDKPSVFVGLSEEEFKQYLLNLVRNDFAFATVRESGKGITIEYESLNKLDTFTRVLEFIGVGIKTETEVLNVISNPALRKLPSISDSNIPHWEILRDATESCYKFYRNIEDEKRTAKQIFQAQLGEIKRVFG